MRFGSVCSGIEAASVAWEPLGWKAAWLSEIEPFPSAVLKHHYPDVPNLGDMTTLPQRIASGEVEAPDLFCGGTPCQAFSVAGLRKSLDDARGNLSLTFCEIANEIDTRRIHDGLVPAIIFWENVPGVLNTKDNAFGCFLAGLAGESLPLLPAGGKWTNAGCVLGPQRAVAWRVLDAQYFGVAQRRRRVFVVASARNDFNPAEVLFEFQGVRRDTAPSREAGQRVAPTVTSGPPFRRPGNDRVETEAIIPQPYAVANCLTQRMYKGINTTLDEGQTPVITHSMRGEGFDASEDGTGRVTPLVPVAIQDVSGRDKAQNGKGWNDDGAAYTVDTHATQGVVQPVAFVQNSRDEVRLMGGDGSLVGALAAEAGMKQQCYVANPVAFPANLSGTQCASAEDISPSMGAKNPMAVAHPVGIDTYNGTITGDVAATLSTRNGIPDATGPRLMVAFQQTADCLTAAYGTKWNGNASAINGSLFAGTAMQVRRLTPVECERLQGFPDGYTAIPWRKRPVEECPDGPRYKALGNSWAVPVVRWIGKRIQERL